MKGSVDVEVLRPFGMNLYAGICGQMPPRADARSGDRIAQAAYLGNSDRFDASITDFAARYADQNERDYAAFAGRSRAVGSRQSKASDRPVRDAAVARALRYAAARSRPTSRDVVLLEGIDVARDGRALRDGPRTHLYCSSPVWRSALMHAVHRRRRRIEQCGDFGRFVPAEHVAQDDHRPLPRRKQRERGDEPRRTASARLRGPRDRRPRPRNLRRRGPSARRVASCPATCRCTRSSRSETATIATSPGLRTDRCDASPARACPAPRPRLRRSIRGSARNSPAARRDAGRTRVRGRTRES